MTYRIAGFNPDLHFCDECHRELDDCECPDFKGWVSAASIGDQCWLAVRHGPHCVNDVVDVPLSLSEFDDLMDTVDDDGRRFEDDVIGLDVRVWAPRYQTGWRIALAE